MRRWGRAMQAPETVITQIAPNQTTVVGADARVPLLDGSLKRYVNLDNAATTPALCSVKETVDEFLNLYSSVHRGSGYKSRYSTDHYELARRRVLSFVGADPELDVCIFGKNATEALNKLANRLDTGEDDVVISTWMEHHSNLLPWSKNHHVVHVEVDSTGRLDLEDLRDKMEHFGRRVRLVTVSGASNVTGYLPQIHEIARMAHAYGAYIAVDAAQLAPHRPIQMRQPDAAASIDFIALSAHKMYAPYGSGALIGPMQFFQSGTPDMVGGGTVDLVTLEEVSWTAPPDRDEAGSPNVLGAVALGAACEALAQIDMEAIAAHERELTRYALARIQEIPQVRLLGDGEFKEDRLGVIPFHIDGVHYHLVAAVLGYEFGIGVRSGCFCAHPYLLRLLKPNSEDTGRTESYRRAILRGDKRHIPGAIRISFGLYNTKEDIDELTVALRLITQGNYASDYHQEIKSGEFVPANVN